MEHSGRRSPNTALVISCVDSKSIPPAIRLGRIGSDANEVEERFDLWTRAIEATPANTHVPIVNLYKGVAWSSIARLYARNRDDLDIWVVSAGLGLIPAAGVAPSYGATFSSGVPDSVGTSRAEARVWWRLLTEHPPLAGRGPKCHSLTDLAERYRSLIVALSASYIDATRDDLMAALESSKDALLITVGGSRTNAPKRQVLRLPAHMRGIVGGTLVSVLNRTLEATLTGLRDGELSAESVRDQLERGADAAPRLERPLRTGLRDEEIHRYIDHLRRAQPMVSRSSALTQLRQAGFACEQNRFRRLFGSKKSPESSLHSCREGADA